MGGAMCRRPTSTFEDDPEEDERVSNLADNQPQAKVVSSKVCQGLETYQVIMITAVSSRTPSADGIHDDARMLAYVISSGDTLDYMIVPLHPDDLRTFGSVVTKVSLDMYSKIRQVKTRKQNFVFSPMQVLTTLAVVYLGARRSTRTELKTAFHLYAFDNKEHLHVALEDINFIIEMIRRYCDLRTVARLYVQDECPFQEEFLSTAARYPKTDIKLVDFVKNAKSVEDEMKEWLSRETDNKFLEAMDVVSGNFTHLSKLVLVSAFTFKGKWVTPFNKEETTTMKFGPNSDTETKVDMMHQRGRFFYGIIDDLNCKVLEIPCRLDCVSVMILLPKKADGLEALEKKITYAHLQTLNRYMHKQLVDVTIPRFTMTDSFNLKDVLRSMDVTSIFEPGKCDLSGIGNGNTELFLSEIFHHAQVQMTDQHVDPVSGGDVDHTTNEDEPHKKFLANRPFMFLVRDNTRTGTVLLMGRMVNPN